MLNTLAAISAGLMSQNFTELAVEHPDWAGMAAFFGQVNWLLALILLSAASAVLTIGISLLGGETIGQLKAKVGQHQNELNEVGNSIKMLLDGLLVNIAKRLRLEQQSQSRLTIYIHDPEREVFVACGRYSPNPVLAAPGRTTYPDNQGCIALGWERGWHFDNAVPPTPGARRSYNQKNYGMSAATTDTIRMNSTLYAVSRLQNAYDKPVALIVFESEQAEGHEEAFLKETLEAFSKDFSRVLETLIDYIPNPARAEEAGL